VIGMVVKSHHSIVIIMIGTLINHNKLVNSPIR